MRPWASVSGTRWTRWTPDSVLEPGECAVAFDLADDLLETAHRVGAGAHDVVPPAPGFGVADVGAEQVGGPESGLVAARAGADFDDHVAFVIGVSREQRESGVGFELLDPLAEFGDLGLREFAHFVVVGFFEDLLRLLQFVGGGAIFVEQADLGLQGGVFFGERLETRRVAGGGGIGHFLLDLVEARGDIFQPRPHGGRV